MSKRRRAGAGRRIAEQRFWGGGPNGSGQAKASQSAPDRSPAELHSASTSGDPEGLATAGDAPGTAAAAATATTVATAVGTPASAGNGSNRPPGRTVGERIRPTPDPAAVVRSLGSPPFAIDGSVAERHLTAVYEEAVRAATALAAANGLLDEDDADYG